LCKQKIKKKKEREKNKKHLLASPKSIDQTAKLRFFVRSLFFTFFWSRFTSLIANLHVSAFSVLVKKNLN